MQRHGLGKALDVAGQLSGTHTFASGFTCGSGNNLLLPPLSTSSVCRIAVEKTVRTDRTLESPPYLRAHTRRSESVLSLRKFTVYRRMVFIT